MIPFILQISFMDVIINNKKGINMIKFLLNTLKLLIGFTYALVIFSLFAYLSYNYYFTDINIHWIFSVSPILAAFSFLLFGLIVDQVKNGV